MAEKTIVQTLRASFPPRTLSAQRGQGKVDIMKKKNCLFPQSHLLALISFLTLAGCGPGQVNEALGSFFSGACVGRDNLGWLPI